MTDIVNIHEAKTHLSRLVEQAAKGQGFIIAKAGKPMVRVLPLEAPPAKRKLGFMAGHGIATADLKRDFAADIEEMFYGPGTPLAPVTSAAVAKRAAAAPKRTSPAPKRASKPKATGKG